MRAHTPIVLIFLALAAAATIAGCASGSGGADGGGGGGPVDARPTDARVSDSGRRDASATDAGPNICSGVMCPMFERCVSGSCRPYPSCAGDGTCPDGEFCHARRCVPGDVDVDGDGSPAGEDCDETSPMRTPGAMEACDAVDNDCDEMVDDGDPAQLCESNPGGGICIDGSCGCPAGTFDLDRTVPGCECTAQPPAAEGLTCATAIDLGSIADTGQMMTVTGNVIPADRVVWYRFAAVDTPDTACDTYHARVLMTDNPGDVFEFTVFQGTCDTLACDDAGYVDFARSTDFGMDVGGTWTGECPCWASPAAPVLNVPACTDQSTSFFVRVRRRPDTTLTCAGYTLEISNGVY